MEKDTDASAVADTDTDIRADTDTDIDGQTHKHPQSTSHNHTLTPAGATLKNWTLFKRSSALPIPTPNLG